MTNVIKMFQIIMTPFTGVGLHGGFRGTEWFEKRIEIFKNYTLKSLMNQSDRNFIHWMTFREQERGSELVEKLHRYLTELKYKHIFTFDGLMYHDDKFTDFTAKTIVRNVGMMLLDMYRHKELRPLEIIKYGFENKNRTLEERLSRSLESLKHGLPVADWVYLTRIDSDDMLHREAVRMIKNHLPKENRALVMKNGYILNMQTGQLADWIPSTNPPFHTIIFPYDVFFDGQKHLEYYKEYKSHESISDIFDCVSLPDKKYLYLTHGKNISTYWNTNKLYLVTTNGSTNIGTRWRVNRLHTWWMEKKNPELKNKLQRGIHPFIGQEYFGLQKKAILKDFGI